MTAAGGRFVSDWGGMRYYCQPCSHRWWQHRHPDWLMRQIGVILMAIGLLTVAMGIVEIIR